MINPEVSYAPHEVYQAGVEQQAVGMDKILLEKKELLARIDEAQVDISAADRKAIESGKLIAAYEHTETGKQSVLIAIGEKVIVVVLKGVRRSESEQYNGVEIIRRTGEVPAVSRNGFEKFNPEATIARNGKIAELNARINDPSTSEMERAKLRLSRDAIGTGSSIAEGGMSGVEQEQIFAKVLSEFQKARGDELASEVRKAIEQAHRKQ